ncbi:unnamed protein product [Lactuca virosa]|uniref:Uncharacterized protein n=1 Tax=Lactuca virosa TaxID=75947 RepID=A0AAU9PG89_9ASTR|nr:unnamed protein product [Lactuca virosa]
MKGFTICISSTPHRVEFTNYSTYCSKEHKEIQRVILLTRIMNLVMIHRALPRVVLESPMEEHVKKDLKRHDMDMRSILQMQYPSLKKEAVNSKTDPRLYFDSERPNSGYLLLH